VRIHTGTLLRWGGLLCWLTELLYISLDGADGQQALQRLTPLEYTVWLSLYLLFGTAYWWATRGTAVWMATGIAPLRQKRLWSCGVMTLSALGTNAIFSSKADLGVLLILIAALLPGLLPWRSTLGWIALQNVGLALVLQTQLSLGSALYTGVFMGIVQMLTALLIQMLGNERRARKSLAELNVNFQFTRAMLQQATREAERTRISRELHDSLGHHLTVLNMELELAAHLSGSEVQVSIERARVLNRLLLADVRESVNDLRGDAEDWKKLLYQVTSGIPGLQVHVDIPPICLTPPPCQAATLLRLTQEAVTNTLKHAQARNLWLSMQCTDCTLIIQIADDGHVHWPLITGNGLKGMQERMNELNGSLMLRPGPQGGLQVEAHFPLAGRL
jgi:signal transduction histidine kinase